MPIESRLTDIPGVLPGNGYAHAVVASGRTGYISGQVALDESGQLVGPGDLRAQTEQAPRNMDKILGELGAGWPDVIRYTWFVVGEQDLQVIRDVRDSFLGGAAKPGSSLIRVAGLFRPDVLIEVEAVVALP